MPLPSALLNTRRPRLALLGALLIGGLSTFAAPPAAAHAAPAVTTDSLDDGLLAWAGRVGQVRRLVSEAEAARPSEAPALSEAALAAARTLAAEPLSAGDATVRTLLVDAQALYERHHGPVAAPLSEEEMAALRGDALVGLLDDDPLALFAHAESPAALLPSTLVYPADAEAIVAREERHVARVFGSAHEIERRTRRYFPMIERVLAERGLPDELKYVAFIESGMNTTAVSPAGAVGMWQMLPSTGAMYGLNRSALTHPGRSTSAATRYLAYLGEMFDGDWQLALAAYNCGPGRVQGLVRRMERRLGRTPTFWDLYPHLPAETRAYVPRFIAVARAHQGVA